MFCVTRFLEVVAFVSLVVRPVCTSKTEASSKDGIALLSVWKLGSFSLQSREGASGT